MSVNLWIKINTTQTRFSQNIETSTLKGGPYKIFISVLLCQCLDIDAVTLPTKFGEVTSTSPVYSSFFILQKGPSNARL